MPTVTFTGKGLGEGRKVEAREGESILDVALNHDVPLEHACGGFCSCTTCHILVSSGQENLSPMEEDEEERMDSNGIRTPSARLGCQARIRAGAVTVEIVNIEG